MLAYTSTDSKKASPPEAAPASASTSLLENFGELMKNLLLRNAINVDFWVFLIFMKALHESSRRWVKSCIKSSDPLNTRFIDILGRSIRYLGIFRARY